MAYEDTIRMSTWPNEEGGGDQYVARQYTDENGNPAGGVDTGRGFCIAWQHGTLGAGADRTVQTGAMPEDVIEAVIRRLEFFQSGQFACAENADALSMLEVALKALHSRTHKRQERGVEGLNKE